MRKIRIALLATLFTLPLAAQIETPNVSQKASVSQTIGTTEIEIEYHRPGVKGRQIWGGLVPWNQPWRMGANEATTISFSTPVVVEGTELPAGTYSFFAIPGQDEWTLVINKDPEVWGAYGYDEKKDALRVMVQPRPSDHTEWMRFTIDPTAPDAAVVTLNWEKIAIPMNVKVDVAKNVWKDVDSTLASNYSSAASWALASGERLEQGLAWADQALAMTGPSLFTLWTKARLLHELGRDDEAAPVMRQALAMAEGNVPDDFWRILQGTMREIEN